MRRFMLRRQNNLAVHRLYWQMRALRQRTWFFAHKSGFKTKSSITNISHSVNILWQLFRSVILSTIFAVFIAGVVLVLGQYGTWLLRLLHAPLWILPLFQGIGDKNQSSYDGFLIGVITVVGIFLTLYLNGVNTVVGTLYVRFPERIRKLLIQERVGNIYVKFLIFLTILSIVLLTAGVMGDIRPRIAILLVAVLSGVAVLFFAQLTWRIFVLFDPTVFAGVLFGEITKWSLQATTRGYQWGDPAFQDYYRRQANEAVEGLKSLVEVANEEQNLQREALATLLLRISRFLPLYLEKKRRIPSDSRWYKLVPQQRVWYLSEESYVTSAAAAQTSLLPDMKPDQRWVETELLSLQSRSLDACIKDGRMDVVFRILNNENEIFEALGEEWDIELGGQLLTDVTSITDSFLTRLDQTAADRLVAHSPLAEKVGIVDFLGLLPITLLLGFVKRLEKIDIERLGDTIGRVQWRRAKAIYEMSLPPPVLERLEMIQHGIAFEQKAEGRRISPDWYIKQLIFQSLSYALVQRIDQLVTSISNYYVTQGRQWIKEQKYLLAAAFIARGLEFHSKALDHLPHLQKLATNLDAAHITEHLPWPEWHWDNHHTTLVEAQKSLSILFARCIPGLVAAQDSDDLPDYLGQVVHFAGEACFRALLANDPDSFSELFPMYFIGILRIPAVLQDKTSQWQPENAVPAIIEPVIDLCELSGYSYLLAEFHQNPKLWAICKDTWDKILQPQAEIVPYVTNAIALNQSLFIITHRATLRTRWQMQFNALLRALPRKLIHRQNGSAIPHYEVVDHPSLLIRTVSGTDIGYRHARFDGLDVFVDLYLLERPEAKGPKPRNPEKVTDAMRRWQESEKKRPSRERRGKSTASRANPGGGSENAGDDNPTDAEE